MALAVGCLVFVTGSLALAVVVYWKAGFGFWYLLLEASALAVARLVVVLEGWLIDGRLALAFVFGLAFGFGFWYALLEGWLWLLVFVIGRLALAVADWLLLEAWLWLLLFGLLFWRAG